MEAITLATKILDECRVQIQANMARRYHTDKGERWVNASGRSSEAFKVEADFYRARLVYCGDDVAPLESIQYGTTEVPTIEQAERWKIEKEASGATDLPSAKGIVAGIRRRGGTERHDEPQDWIIGPVVEAAVAALNDQLPRKAVEDIKNMLFEQKQR